MVKKLFIISISFIIGVFGSPYFILADSLTPPAAPRHIMIDGVCVSSWKCGEWGACINNLQSRICQDENYCNLTEGKPAETQSCSLINPDCEYQNYKMAFLLVENLNNLAAQADIDLINRLKQETSQRFFWATKGLATMDTSYPVKLIRLENNPSLADISKEFYKSNPDDFHFITIFITYDNSGSQYHLGLKNNISGIGLGKYDATDFYGSDGKLLGINWMKNISMYRSSNFDHDLIFGVNGILHETSHQWGAFVNFIDVNGQATSTLRNPYNMAHWDKKLETGYGLLSGFSWIDNSDGTFTAKTITDGREKYSNLDLYLMGLISKNEVGPIKLIVSSADTKTINQGSTIPGTMKTISVDQIISAEGDRVCTP